MLLSKSFLTLCVNFGSPEPENFLLSREAPLALACFREQAQESAR